MSRSLIALVVAAIWMHGTAAAQSAPRGVTLGFGAGRVVGVATDDSGAKTIFAGTTRFAVSPRVAIEIEIAHIGRETIVHSGPGVISTVENNVRTVVARYDDTTTRQGDATWSTAVNLLAHSRGRVSIFGGGGLGFGVTERFYSVSRTSCTSPTRPQLGDTTSVPRHNASLTFEVATGVNMPIAERIGGFAAVRVSSGYLYRPGTLGALGGVTFRVN